MSKIATLKKRAQYLYDLRAFFYAHHVMEVDTPILSQAATPDAHLQSLKTHINLPGIGQNQPFYAHTSPEYAMKRLLCEGCGDIYYLGKVFRNGDLSKRHQPEFTLLEWYRLGFSLADLMTEVAEVIQLLLGEIPVEYITYQQAFQRYAKLDNIFTATPQECQTCLKQHGIPSIIGVDENDSILWEQLVFTEVIEPQLGWENKALNQPKITCVSAYPARDAALAQISKINPWEAERFEVFVKGMELANGYHELQDAQEYQNRFNESLKQRQQLGYKSVPIDQNLITALAKKGLPDCSGVALGIDRLIMLALKATDIEQVVTFGIKES